MKLNQILKSKTSILFLLTLFVGQMTYAIDAKISAWKTTIQTTLDAAVLVFAIVGGFIIFLQYMQGNEQAQKNFVKFCIGLGIFAVAELIVGVFV